MIFYEMQQRTGLDFGWCPDFVPAYRKKVIGLIEDRYNLEHEKCTYDREVTDTTCNGTSRDICVLRGGI